MFEGRMYGSLHRAKSPEDNVHASQPERYALRFLRKRIG